MLSVFLIPTPLRLLIPVTIGAVLLMFPLRRHKALSRYLLSGLSGILLACLVGGCYLHFVRAPILSLDGKTVALTGEITDVRFTSKNSIHYTLAVRYGDRSFDADWYADGALPRMEIGELVAMEGTLSALPSDYLHKTAGYGEGIGKYLRIQNAQHIISVGKKEFSLRRTLRDYRETIVSLIHRQLPEHDAALLLAMLFGDRSSLDDDTSAALYHTGIGHITAVSGLHLMFFCAMLNSLLRRLSVSPKKRFFFDCAAVVVFSTMVDSAVSVARAGLMFLLAEAAVLFRRYPDTLRSLCLAILACTVTAPYVIRSASFWLSVSGVLGIGILAPWMLEAVSDPEQPAFLRLGIVRSLLELSCVSVAVFPASILCCGESSLLSPICNLVILPLSTLALTIALLTVCTGGLAAFLLPIAGALCRMVTVLAEAVARLPYSQLRTTDPVMCATLLACTGFVVLMLLLTRSQKSTAYAILCAMILLTAQLAVTRRSDASSLKIAVLGAQKGCVLVVSKDGRTIVTDFSGKPDAVKAVGQYLSDSGKGHMAVDFLYCPPESAAAYHQTLPGGARAVCFSKPTTLRPSTTLCGVTRGNISSGDFSLKIGDGTLTLSPERAELTQNDTTVTFVSQNAKAPVCADIVIYCGEKPETEDACRILIPTADPDPKYQLLTISENGAASLKPLPSS